MAFLDTINELLPDGATQPVSVLDNYQREHRNATRSTVGVEHHLTGEHKIPAGNIADRPPFGKIGRLYVNTELKIIQRDTGLAWENIVEYFQKQKVGTFTGNASPTQIITGLGFQPTALWVIPLTGTNPSFIKTVNFAVGESHKLSDNTTAIDGIDTLDSDGFSVKAAANVNTVVYAYIAIRDRP